MKSKTYLVSGKLLSPENGDWTASGSLNCISAYLK